MLRGFLPLFGMEGRKEGVLLAGCPCPSPSFRIEYCVLAFLLQLTLFETVCRRWGVLHEENTARCFVFFVSLFVAVIFVLTKHVSWSHLALEFGIWCAEYPKPRPTYISI
jgi:hypothetical protein